jgi:hypothetical protein
MLLFAKRSSLEGKRKMKNQEIQRNGMARIAVCSGYLPQGIYIYIYIYSDK